MDMPNDTKFTEIQYMRQWWLIAIILGGDVFSIIVVWFALSKSSPNHLPLALSIMGVLMVGMTALMLASHLKTEVKTEGLYVRYMPFHFHDVRIPLDNVASVEAVTYSPLGDYGGWGIRYGKNGKAYNASGNRGVKINYSSGPSILIGSQKAEELAEAVKSLL